MLHFLDSRYKLQIKDQQCYRELWSPRSELHNLTILFKSNDLLFHFNRYTIQCPDTSYDNLEHRLIIMSDNFNPLSNSTSALLKFWIWSDVILLLVMHTIATCQNQFEIFCGADTKNSPVAGWGGLSKRPNINMSKACPKLAFIHNMSIVKSGPVVDWCGLSKKSNVKRMS